MRAATPQQEQIISRKLLSNLPLTQNEIGLLFGVSRNRIEQIEKRAIRKLRGAILVDREARAVAEDVLDTLPE